MIKIVSWNVNGIRACYKKGFMDFLKEYEPDICCIQESKADQESLPDEIVNPSGYSGIWNSANRKGYSGVATFTKANPIFIQKGFGLEKFDTEGRVIETHYDKFILFNVYFPNGQKDETRLNYKLEFYKEFFSYIKVLMDEGKSLIIAGDYNTAHTEIDLANPKANENYSGFLPIERKDLDKIIQMGLIDSFRHFHPGEKDHYTWWTYRFGARKSNIGWRIDYFFLNQPLMANVKKSYILPEVLGSDHCPIVLELDF